MQYALIEIQNEKRLVSANEVHALRTYTDAILEQDKPVETEHPYHVCYGCYLPQPGIDVAEALDDFESSRDHWLGYVEQDKCHIIAFHDAVPLEPVRRGLALTIPFAALVQANPPIIEAIGDAGTVQAVTGFLRYEDVSPANNVLNRPGIIALKGIERRVKEGQATPGNWHQHIDLARAKRTAQAIG